MNLLDELRCRDLCREVRSSALVVRQRAEREEPRKSIRKKQPEELLGMQTVTTTAGHMIVVIRVYNAAGKVVEANRHKGGFVEP